MKVEKVLKSLPDAGINLEVVTQSLEDEGVDKFVKPFDFLMRRISEKRDGLLEEARKKTV